ncbi:MAG: hypothetical protein ACREF9_04305 [Opitutaceae bacterium]
MPTESVSFDALVTRLKDKSCSSLAGRNLVIPKRPEPFVAQTATVESYTAETGALDSDVLIFAAPAAVGKTTFARALSADSGVPLLDLSKIRVATHSLRGILSAEIGPDGPKDLGQGNLCVIVDALDEGRLLSGEKNFEEFLNTALALLDSSAGPQRPGPRLVLFGRPAAVALTSIVLELEAPNLSVTSLMIDYFDEGAATDLILAHVRLFAGPEKVSRFEDPIRQTILAFFEAIGTAIGRGTKDLWKEPQGRAFAGYAPVLAAVGALIGRQDNYTILQRRLRESGIRDAWGVLQEVSEQVLAREHDKVYQPLSDTWGKAVPQKAYDPTDQLELLTGYLTARSTRVSPRLAFGSGGASNAYLEAIKAHLPEHPFLRDGVPVNDVLGSLVVAHALAKGADTQGGQAPQLCAAYGRQPFLWRFFQRMVTDDLIASGDQLSYLLGSYWSEGSGSTQARLKIEGAGDGAARVTYEGAQNGTSFRVLPPIVLRGEIRDLSVDIPNDEVEIAGWPGADAPLAQCAGEVLVRARALHFELERLQVGQLGSPSSCTLVANEIAGDQRLTVDMHENSRLSVGGGLAGRYPWDNVAKTEQEPPRGDAMWNLLADCAQRLPGSLPVVVYESLELTDDPREWAKRHGDLFPKVLRLLVNRRIATTSAFASRGDTTKMRVRPNCAWSELLDAYEGSSEAYPSLRAALRELAEAA